MSSSSVSSVGTFRRLRFSASALIFLSLYVVLDILAAFYVREYISQIRTSLQPTLATFENSLQISGLAAGNLNRKGGVIPTISGYQLACGSSFVGISRECSKLSRSIVYGAQINARAVLIDTMGGRKWLVLSIRMPDGFSYDTTPQAALQDWNENSDFLIKWTPVAVFFLLLMVAVIPMFVIWITK